MIIVLWAVGLSRAVIRRLHHERVGGELRIGFFGNPKDDTVRVR